MPANIYSQKEWHELKVGKGVDVGNIPIWLGKLAEPDCPRWEVTDLSCLYERGKIHSAAAKAVPEMIKLLNSSDTPHKDTILMILGSLACASQSTRMVWGVDFNKPDIKKFYGSGVAKEVWKSVWSARDTYLNMLADSDAMVRSTAAFILGFDFAGAKTNLEIIIPALAKETEVKTRASMLLSIGMMQGYAGVQKVTIDFEAYAGDSSQDTLVRGASVIAQIYSSAQPVKLSPEQHERLVEWCHLSEVDVDGYPWNNGVTDMHASRVVEGRCEEGGLVAAEMLADCIRRHGPHGRSSTWARGILALAFPEAELKRAAGPFLIDASIYDFSQFSDRQRALMAVMASYSFDAPFQQHGMPAQISDRRRWLGLEEPGPMERIVEVEVLGEPRKWPVWKCLSEQQASKPNQAIDVEALLGGVLTPTELLEVRLEYSKMAYGLRLGGDVFELVMARSKEMLPYARRHLRYMSRMFNEFGAVHVNCGAKAAVTAMHVLIKEGCLNEILPEDDMLLDAGTSVIYKHFDIARREKFILDRLESCFVEDDTRFWYAKNIIHNTLANLDYFATDKVANRLFDLRDHILKSFNGFSEERLAIETECGNHVDQDAGFANVVKQRSNAGQP